MCRFLFPFLHAFCISICKYEYFCKCATRQSLRSHLVFCAHRWFLAPQKHTPYCIYQSFSNLMLLQAWRWTILQLRICILVGSSRMTISANQGLYWGCIGFQRFMIGNVCAMSFISAWQGWECHAFQCHLVLLNIFAWHVIFPQNFIFN